MGENPKVRILKMDAARTAQVRKSLESESQNPENGRNKDSTGQEKLVSGTRTGFWIPEIGPLVGFTPPWAPWALRGPWGP